ncbi:hypothetical protein CMQ_3741 [Grosmannia clavigera kw1407]|uniref:Uncharacterized protein n=1 Tax=Grosmannia clavigera (strain kw1407 / UAMH 11150) TaxID=655863 RepID=F0XA47_GROCL|nr:uncharacterized protein CMQ_3741 [Grosmannia clavigera kw1407]EFX05672.1 hypothetical protein CMQ_3741 [Grosmannia clavigera kw1407]
MIRLPLTTLFVTMDEVKGYETRQPINVARAVGDAHGTAGQIYEQDEMSMNPVDTESQAQPTAFRGPRPKTPEQRHSAARNNLVIRSTSQQSTVPLNEELPFVNYTGSRTQIVPDTSLGIGLVAGADGDPGSAANHNVDDDAEKVTPTSSRLSEGLSERNTRQGAVSNSPQSARWLAMPPQRASPAWRAARQDHSQATPIDESPR